MKRIYAMGLAVLVCSASCGKKKSAPAAGSAGPAGSTSVAATPTVPDPLRDAAATSAKEAVDALAPRSVAQPDAMLGAVVDVALAASKTVPREAWDPAAVIAAVGKDRVALFRWVRDHTALVSYAGSLRGAVGVMMDRVGNSLDRSLLLAELLSQAGYQVRLTSATLPAGTIDQLVAAQVSRARPALPPEPPAGDLLAPLAAITGADPAAVAAKVAGAEAAAQALIARTRQRISEQRAALATMVKPLTAAPPRSADALAEHWWVQIETGEAWSELDPSMPTAEPGETLAVAGDPVAVEAIDDGRRHTLAIRVIGEVWQDGARQESVLLEHSFAPSQFFGQRISITNMPLDLPPAEALRTAPRPAAAARAAVVAQVEWIPMLRIGTSVVAKMSVTDAGELYDVSAPDANTTRLARAIQQATRAGVGGATDLLGSLPDDSAAGPGAEPAPARPAAAAAPGFTAEWIELELRAPGAAPRIVRRTVFDTLAGAADRAARPSALTESARLDRGLALLGETELLPMFAQLPSAFVIDRIGRALAAARPALVELAALRGAPPSEDLSNRLARLEALPGALYGLAVGRFAWSGVGSDVYLDQLNVLTRWHRLVGEGASVRRRESFDIVANAIAVWPGAKADARAVRMTQGIADTAIESVVMDCGPRCVRGDNTSDAFAAAATGTAGAGRWTVAAPGDPAPAGLAPSARVLAEADLLAGYAVVAPPGSGGRVWWRVDPATGETLGMSPTGGSVSAEAVVQLAVFVGEVAQCYFSWDSSSWWQRAGCGVGAAFGLLGGGFGLAANALTPLGRGLGFAITIIGATLTTVSSAP